jgi:hypothetical protein
MDPMMDKQNPRIAISRTVNLFVVKAIIFGPVLTGSKNAKDAEMVAGIIK